MVAAGYDLTITHPRGYELDEHFTHGAKIVYDQEEAFRGADFIYAKNWAAYRDPLYGKILSKDMSWMVDSKKMKLTNDAYFMHCLPVRRNMIVSDQVLDSPASLVIPQAANRETAAQAVIKSILETLVKHP